MTTRPGSRPPGLARAILDGALPRDLCDDVVANLDDLYGARVFRRGRIRADAWYWRQALTLPLRLRLSPDRVPRPAIVNMNRSSPMRLLLQDLAYALRMYRARPAFTLVAVLSLAVAIGFNTAIFSVVDGVLLRAAPLADFDRLVMVWETDRNTNTTREPASIPDYLDYRNRTTTLDALGLFIAGEANFAPAGDDPIRIAALSVTPELLPLLGIRPIAGRALTDDDLQPGRSTALISESFWARHLDRASLDDLSIVLNDVRTTVVGVVPDTTDFGVLQVLSSAAYSRSFADRGTRVRVEVWVPLRPDPAAFPRSTHPAFMLGRLRPGTPVAAAESEMTRLAADLETEFPTDNRGRGAHVEALSSVIFGPVRPAFLALLGAVGLVLLVACVNVASLLLAQGEVRRREVAIRRALGAGRGRLARQFLTETVLLTGVAGLIGVGLAFGILNWLVATGPADVPRLADAAIDLRVLLVMFTTVIVVGVVFGLVPTLQSGRTAPQAALAAGAERTAGGRRRTRLRAALVVAELALAVMLVVGAGLLVQSLANLRAIDPGFESAGIAKAEYQLPASRYPSNFANYPDFAEQHAFRGRLLERARALPGLTAVAIAGNHPLEPGFTNSFVVVGREAESAGWPEISVRPVTAGYFETVNLPILDGRAIEDSDLTTGPAVAVINAAARDRFFPDGPAIGHEIRFWGTSRRIVGIVENERFQGLTAGTPVAVYTPLSQTPGARGVLLARTSGDPTAVLGSLRSAIREVDPALAVYGLEAMTETMERATSEPRFTAMLVTLFAVMALGLAALGVHGVLSYAVAQRTREIGIRMALGARPERVRGLVVLEALTLSGIGLAAGLLGAWVLSRFIDSLLYGVGATDLATYAAVCIVLVVVAVAASYAPARRATRIDPSAALRSEP